MVLADAFFSTSTFETRHFGVGFPSCQPFPWQRLSEPSVHRSEDRRTRRAKTLDGKTDFSYPDCSRMERPDIYGLDGLACTLVAYAKAMKEKVRLAIWVMPNGSHKLFFSTKLCMTGEGAQDIHVTFPEYRDRNMPSGVFLYSVDIRYRTAITGKGHLYLNCDGIRKYKSIRINHSEKGSEIYM